MATREQLVLGIDEAGRGPVLGPLTMCGALLGVDQLAQLKALGVADSKQLTAKRREALFDPLRALLRDFMIIEFSPAQIDDYRSRNELDVLEAQGAAKLILTLDPDTAYVDGLGPGGKLHRKRIESCLNGHRARLVVENKADARYPIVSAASILAKVTRDRAISALAAEHGPIGSGYPGDPKTRAYVQALVSSGEPLPDFVRKSWATVTQMVDRQGTLFDLS